MFQTRSHLARMAGVGGAAAAELSRHLQSEVVEVLDEEEGRGEEVGRRARVTRKSSMLGDRDVLCEFPPGRSPAVAVTLRDYRTLQLDTFLNDIIIDFYLSLTYERLAPDERSKVHLFTTMFYTRLITVPTKVNLENIFEKDENLGDDVKRHIRVRGWSKKVDLFSKQLVVVPVCEHSHWYLVVVARLDLVARVEGEGEEGPFMFVLDSLGGQQEAAAEVVRAYLAQEWRAKVSCVSPLRWLFLTTPRVTD